MLSVICLVCYILILPSKLHTRVFKLRIIEDYRGIRGFTRDLLGHGKVYMGLEGYTRVYRGYTRDYRVIQGIYRGMERFSRKRKQTAVTNIIHRQRMV